MKKQWTLIMLTIALCGVAACSSGNGTPTKPTTNSAPSASSAPAGNDEVKTALTQTDAELTKAAEKIKNATSKDDYVKIYTDLANAIRPMMKKAVDKEPDLIVPDKAEAKYKQVLGDNGIAAHNNALGGFGAAATEAKNRIGIKDDDEDLLKAGQALGGAFAGK